MIDRVAAATNWGQSALFSIALVGQ